MNFQSGKSCPYFNTSGLAIKNHVLEQLERNIVRINKGLIIK